LQGGQGTREPSGTQGVSHPIPVQLASRHTVMILCSGSVLEGTLCFVYRRPPKRQLAASDVSSLILHRHEAPRATAGRRGVTEKANQRKL
jgi:hypothetical protein